MDPRPLVSVMTPEIHPDVANLKVLRAFQQASFFLWGRIKSFPSQKFPASLWSRMSRGRETLGSLRGYCASCYLRTCTSSSWWESAASGSCPLSFLWAHADKTWLLEVVASRLLLSPSPSGQQLFLCHFSGDILRHFIAIFWLRGSLICLHTESRIPQGRSCTALDNPRFLTIFSLNWSPWGH